MDINPESKLRSRAALYGYRLSETTDEQGFPQYQLFSGPGEGTLVANGPSLEVIDDFISQTMVDAVRGLSATVKEAWCAVLQPERSTNRRG